MVSHLEPELPYECKPLYSLHELMHWNTRYQPLCNVASKGLSKHHTLKSSGPRTLVCHDMKGGYLDDRFSQGVTNAEAYRFFHWPHVDIFVYFSHYFITIPPPAWINAAHKHDVLILGTFITEWDDGKARCKEILKSEESFKSAANQMVFIATHYGFDGWLINVENVIQAEKVVMLRDFVKYLTSEMHKIQKSSLVIWYDSVIETGELKWQDSLNDHNKMFFDVCDGIFLNYTWKEEKLSQSAVTANHCERLLDVYVGVDIFGRGCLGNGGFNTNQAVDVARKYNLSVALFAQGWVYEKAEGNMQTFTDNEYKFWKLLGNYLEKNPVKTLPFYTSFCQGQGHKYYENGKVISGCPWTNISLQNVQPVINDCEDVKSIVNFNDAYQGGGCLCIEGSLKSPEDCVYSVLYSFDVSLPKKCLFLYTFKAENDTVVFIDVILMKRSTEESVRFRLCSDEGIVDKIKHVGNNNITTLCITPLKSVDEIRASTSVSEAATGTDQWETRAYLFENLEEYFLKSLAVCMMCQSSDPYPQKKNLLLGQLQISENKSLSPISVLDLEVVSSLITQQEDAYNHLSVSCVLQWLCNSEELGHFNVYYCAVSGKEKNESTENLTLIGRIIPCRSEKNRYKVISLVVDRNEYDSVLFKVQPVYYNGKSVCLDDMPSIRLDLSLD